MSKKDILKINPKTGNYEAIEELTITAGMNGTTPEAFKKQLDNLKTDIKVAKGVDAYLKGGKR